MRLSQQQITAIKALAAETFSDNVAEYLFGCQIDDTRQGGDIDLYVKTDHGEVPVRVEGVGKKFCRDLKQSPGRNRGYNGIIGF